MCSSDLGYKDFPEETATRMLSNDLLIDQLRRAENDKVFQEYVESAIVAQNAEFAEEITIMAEKLEQEIAAKLKINEQLELTNQQREKEHIQAEEEKRKYEQM